MKNATTAIIFICTLFLILNLVSCFGGGGGGNGEGENSVNRKQIPNANVFGCFLDDYPDPVTSEYVLPYQIGTTHFVNQGNCGQFITHRPNCIAFNTTNQVVSCGDRRYAYDFRMPIGTVILAARGGEVFFISDGFGNETNGVEQVNFISILHDDGTIGSYGHLSPNSFMASVGDIVQQGDPIALSGSSGQTGFNNPHLHFDVLAPPFTKCTRTDMSECKSLPVTFRNAKPLDAPLIQGVAYLALPF